MLFNTVVILLLCGVIYFHFLQGLFSAGLSAICALIAAIVAVGYHETLVDLLLKGRMADQAHGMMLTALFAATYLVLRLLFDSLIPGNVRFHVLVDKIGASVFGLIAGILAVGVLAVAAQTLPFGPSIAQYCRYPVEFGKKIAVKGQRGEIDTVYDELNAKAFLEGDASKLLIPVDDIVLNIVDVVSDADGALDSGRPFRAAHPDYLQELFGQRLSLQTGSKHTALPEKTQVLGEVYVIPGAVDQVDPERIVSGDAGVGTRGPKAQPKPPALPDKRVAKPNHMLIVVQTVFHRDDSDKNSHFSFTPAGIRLVAGGSNYFPIGTMEGGTTLFAQQPDDLLFCSQDKGAELVFELPRSVLEDPKAEQPKLGPDVTLEVKRMARVDLGGKRLVSYAQAKPNDSIAVVRKAAQTPLPPGCSLSIDGTQVLPASQLMGGMGIGIGTTDPDTRGDAEWGKYEVRNRKFVNVEVDPVRSSAILSGGGGLVSEFDVPQGVAMLQVTALPRGDDKWKWASELARFELKDSNGKSYKPNGAMAKVSRGNQDSVVLRYHSSRPYAEVPADRGTTPNQVMLLFLIPRGTMIQEVTYSGSTLQAGLSVMAQ